MNIITYLNFGRIPTTSRRNRVKQLLFGYPNIYKRLQAPDIMRAIDPKSGESILDFGCGCGYITFAIARYGANATGIDVDPYVATIEVPANLSSRLTFKQASGTSLPFSDASFDKILASEVLPMIPNPVEFMKEIMRVLKPNGKLIIVNGLGPLAVKEAYDTNSPKLEEFKKKYGQIPPSYPEYIRQWQVAAKTAVKEFITEEQILGLVEDSGFKIGRKSYSPSKKVGDYLALSQFDLFLSSGKIIREEGFLKEFLKLSFLSLADTKKYKGGLILTASKK